MFYANGNFKKISVIILISHKIDFETKVAISDREYHFIMIKGLIQHKDITLINNYMPNKGAHKHIKQILRNIKQVNNSNTI